MQHLGSVSQPIQPLSQLNDVGSSTANQVHPWTQCQLQLLFALPVPSLRIAPRMSPPLSPFPRCGHSLAKDRASSSGDIFLFGGIVGETMQNDLYVLSAEDLSATLLDTIGYVPYPRTGHACALLSDIFVVWGGDSDSPATREELSREVSMLDLCKFTHQHSAFANPRVDWLFSISRMDLRSGLRILPCCSLRTYSHGARVQAVYVRGQ